MNKGDPRKALRTRPQPTTSVPVIGKSPGNEVGGITYVKMPTSALCTCISFSLVLCFFKTLNSNFTFECPTNAILQRVSKTVADQRGGLVPPLFFDQQYKSVYRCAYARTQNENMQIKWIAAWLSLGLFVRSKISVLGFPTRNTPVSKLIWVIYEPEEWNHQITSTGRSCHFLWDKTGINCGIKPGRLREISPFGGVARSQARAARERRRMCEGPSPLARAFSRGSLVELITEPAIFEQLLYLIKM